MSNDKGNWKTPSPEDQEGFLSNVNRGKVNDPKGEAERRRWETG